AIDSVVHRLDSEWIPRQNQPPLPFIPNRQAEHAIQAIEHLVTPLLVSMHDHFGVRLCAEHMPGRFQLAPHLLEVIDLAVEDYPNSLLGVRHGLMSAGEINDREPAKAKSERSGDVISLIIRTSVGEAPSHGFDIPAPDR